MSELDFLAKDLLVAGRQAPSDVVAALDDTLLSAIATPGQGHYATPSDAFRRVVA